MIIKNRVLCLPSKYHKNEWIVFDCDSLEIKRTDKHTAKIINCIANGEPTEQWESDEVKQIKRKLQALDTQPQEVPQEKIRLILNTANTCNMNCGYCYANGGHYNSEEQLMSIDTAKRAIDVFYANFSDIGSIKFIGGEPLVNWKVVKFVCDYVGKLYNEKSISSIPSFIVATNGTILNEEIIEYSIKYNWRVGLSFDGRDDLHDLVRVDRKGAGTSKIIKDNISLWQQRTEGKCPSSINSCYSSVQESNGLSPADAAIYMRDELNVKKVNIVPVDSSKDSKYHLEAPERFGEIGADLEQLGEYEYSRYAITKLKKLEKLLREKMTLSQHICKAGITTFGVSVKGVISPCHLLTDVNGFYMGSVYDEEPFSTSSFTKIHTMLKNEDRMKNAKCSICFANRICNGCIGGNLFRTGNAWESDPEICGIFKTAVTTLIQRISKDGEWF